MTSARISHPDLCVRCAAKACQAREAETALPEHCPMRTAPDLIEEATRQYEEDAELRRLGAAAARTEAAGYGRDTRVEEVMAFARRLGVERIGIAHCVGLRREADIARAIFEAKGYSVSAVCCKVGAVPKETLGLRDDEKVRPGGHESICSPVAQARLLDAAGCGLNVALGLCVGHDSLFFRHSQAPVTVLVAKDRVTGHNPAAALYNARSYYRRLLKKA